MGKESVTSEQSELATNGKAGVEKKAKVEEMTEDVTEKREEQHSGAKEMEEDKGDNGKVESQDMDVDKEEVNQSKDIKEKGAKEIEEEGKEEPKGEGQKQESIPEEAKEEIKSKEIEGDSREKTKKEMEDKVEEEIDGVKEEEKPEELKEEKSWKKRPRTKSSAGKKEKGKKKEPEEEKEKEKEKEKEPKTPTEKKTKQPKTMVEKKEELKTPAAPTIDRPVRERKSVERLVATIDKDFAKEFHVEKGRGTALKDIPKVAYKLSRKKTDDTFKLLHTILFGRRGKAAQVKNNISRFSGFVWHDNEEKQLIKVKEKLDKCVKEKLVEFCDVLDIPISKGNTRKEDIIAKLIEFLVAPHSTDGELLAEKEQSSKGKKRKRVSKSASGSDMPAKGSAKSRKKTESTSKKGGETKNTLPESGEEEEAHEEEGINGVPKRSDDEMSEEAETEKKESDSEEEPDEDKGKRKRGSAKSSAKKKSAEKAKTEKVTISKKASPPPEKTPAKSPRSRSKNNSDMSAKKSFGKKKDESVKKLSSPKKSASKESTGKKVLKVKDKPSEEKIRLSDDDLRKAICEILKEVDFNTATFTDILKLLAKQFDMDLTSSKSSIKIIIQDELTKLADADEADDEEDEGDTKKDIKGPSSRGVNA